MSRESGKTYKNAEEIFNFIKNQREAVVLISLKDLNEKDQQIKQLQEEVDYLKLITPVTRKEWEQKAVKEFADELMKLTFLRGYEQYIEVMVAVNFEKDIKKLLKERGVE